MRRLRGTDALFLALETPAWHQQVGSLLILDSRERPVTYADVVAGVERRLEWAPKFMWKVRNVPFGLDRPMWVDEQNLDIHRHVRRASVPNPGGLRETAEVAGALMSTQLDRDQPLWELWFLEGLSSERVALLLKYHHCLLDGTEGASLATALLDLDPNATEPSTPRPSPEAQTAGPELIGLELLSLVAGELGRRPFRIARYLAAQTERLVADARIAVADNRRAVLGRPITPFNAAIGPHRALAFASVALDDLRAIKSRYGVKVNDVVLALVASSVRAYLLDLDMLPDVGLVAAVPVSVRGDGDRSPARVSTMVVSLGTDIDEPLARLRAINEASAKAMPDTPRAQEIQSLGNVASPLVLSMALRAIFRTHLMSRAWSTPDTVVSNVPGPEGSLYACGARVEGAYAASALMEGQGMTITVMSHGGRVDFGLQVDPDLVPDPWLIADRIPGAVAELLQTTYLIPATTEGPFGA